MPNRRSLLNKFATARSSVKYARLVLAPLVCSGVIAALDVRRSGFPTRVCRSTALVREFRVLYHGRAKVTLLCS